VNEIGDVLRALKAKLEAMRGLEYPGGAVHVGVPVVTHSLKGAWFQPLSLSSENPVSKFAAFLKRNFVPLK
jgi:hypothetical protein